MPLLTVLLAAGAMTGSLPSAASPAPNSVITSAIVPAQSSPDVQNAVVKVFATVRHPEPYQPWTKASPREISGSGIVIEGHRILTNAHVVLYASQIQIQANQSGDKISATVEAVAPGIDLAVLKLNDETFFDTHPPLRRARTLPNVKDPVLVYGFPEGGTSMSITKGIVSRIEFTGYNYPVSGLRIQIDAAINPGNSGGPAVAGDQMIGVAFSHLGGAENIGYIIPSEEVDLFLEKIKGGATYSKAGLYDDLQTLQNPALRRWLKAGPTIRGMVVTHPDSDAPDYPLKAWDVITRIGGTPIDDEGMISINDLLRVSFKYLVQKTVHHGKVTLRVYRGGKLLDLEVPAPAERPMLVDDLRGRYPSYFVYGPIVFSAVTDEFYVGISGNAGALNALSIVKSPLVLRRGDRPAFPGEQLVVVSSPFFPNDLVKGYDNATAAVVDTINGIHIRNLKHLVEVLRDCKDPYIQIDFAGHEHENLIFDRAEMLASTDDILNDNGVRSQGSPDMMDVWQAKPAAR
ncbi:MAG TPA: trypsin-like peptidase domain-containing protein [Opitutaceae bacterium]|nr:trypsin-like peptidase domain-containing protein [Opitutaceae bacterium]